MDSAFFISDVHLVRMASPQGEAMLSLLQTAKNEASLLVILGDLFDLWVGKGKAFQEEFAPLIDALKKFRKKGRIFYFEGNHDFHLTKFWAKDLGFEVFLNAHSFEFAGKKIRAEHGDEINRDDHGYLFLRWFLRSAPLKFLIETLPSRLIFKIGQRASATSRVYTASLENKSIEIFRKYAETLRATEHFDLLVTGHSHVPDDFAFERDGKKARLINLGSWFDGPHYLKLSADGRLREVKI